MDTYNLSVASDLEYPDLLNSGRSLSSPYLLNSTCLGGSKYLKAGSKTTNVYFFRDMEE